MALKYTLFALLLFCMLSSGCGDTSSTDREIIRRYCESAPFTTTDLAVRKQIVSIPDDVQESLLRLQRKGDFDYIPHLCYLFLKDYLYQTEQFASGYTLHPGVPYVLTSALLAGFQEKGLSIPNHDLVSSEITAMIVENPSLVCDNDMTKGILKDAMARLRSVSSSAAKTQDVRKAEPIKDAE